MAYTEWEDEQGAHSFDSETGIETIHDPMTGDVVGEIDHYGMDDFLGDEEGDEEEDEEQGEERREEEDEEQQEEPEETEQESKEENNPKKHEDSEDSDKGESGGEDILDEESGEGIPGGDKLDKLGKYKDAITDPKEFAKQQIENKIKKMAAEKAGQWVAAATSEIWAPVAIGCLIIIGIIIVIVVLALFINALNPDGANADPVGTKTVVCVDPGHVSELYESNTQADYDKDQASWEKNKKGANDGAASKDGKILERVINQQVADLLKIELISRGYEVYETKTDADAFMSNRARGKFCKAKGANVIIKVHNDGDGPEPGMIFYTSNKTVIKDKWDVKNEEGEYFVRREDATIEEDKKLAEALNKAFKSGTSKYNLKYASGSNYPSRIIEHSENRAFGYTYDIPTSLLELSSLEQTDDANFIKDPKNQQNIVEAFADGLEAYIPASTGGKFIDGVLDVPYWNQFRNDPNNCSGGTHWATTGSKGCGATSATMVIQFITGEKLTPDQYTAKGGANQWDCGLVNKLIKSKGVQYQCYVPLGDPETALRNIEKSIQKGYPGVVHMNPPYACSQHIMVVTGFDKDGNVYVNDPNCGGCGSGDHNSPSGRWLKVGNPAGKNDLAPREKFKDAMRSHYEYVK